jgi:type II secretory pathway pseudopilin PulG
MKHKSVTLVEIVVSMVILSLILLGIVGIFVAGKKQLKRTQYKQEALNFARQKLEELEACDFDDTSCLVSGLDNPKTGWSRTWVITEQDLDGDTFVDQKNITVMVQWPEPSP